MRGILSVSWRSPSRLPNLRRLWRRFFLEIQPLMGIAANLASDQRLWADSPINVYTPLSASRCSKRACSARQRRPEPRLPVSDSRCSTRPAVAARPGSRCLTFLSSVRPALYGAPTEGVQDHRTWEHRLLPPAGVAWYWLVPSTSMHCYILDVLMVCLVIGR